MSPPVVNDVKIQDYESSYSDYLSDSRHLLAHTAMSCQHWIYPYNGETPSPNVFDLMDDSLINSLDDSVLNRTERTDHPGGDNSGNISLVGNNSLGKNSTNKVSEQTRKILGGTALKLNLYDRSKPSSQVIPDSPSPYSLPDYKTTFEKTKDGSDFRSYLSVTGDTVRTDAISRQQYEILQILRAFDLEAENWCPSQGGMEEFMSYLGGTETPPEIDQDETIEESVSSLDSILFDMCSNSRTSTPMLDSSEPRSLQDFDNTETSYSKDMSKLTVESTELSSIPSFDNSSVSDVSPGDSSTQKSNTTSFVEISMAHFENGESSQNVLSKLPRQNSETSEKDAEFKSPSKSVSFSLPKPSMQQQAPPSPSGNAPANVKTAEPPRKVSDDAPTIGNNIYLIYNKKCNP